MSYVLGYTILWFFKTISCLAGKSKMATVPTVFWSLAASTAGLLSGGYCRGVSTDVGLEIAALPRFAASK